MLSKTKKSSWPICRYLCGMKKLLKLYRRWRYRRLYTKLIFMYAERLPSSNCSDFNIGAEADVTFSRITGLDYWVDVVGGKRNEMGLSLLDSLHSN